MRSGWGIRRWDRRNGMRSSKIHQSHMLQYRNIEMRSECWVDGKG